MLTLINRCQKYEHKEISIYKCTEETDENLYVFFLTKVTVSRFNTCNSVAELSKIFM